MKRPTILVAGIALLQIFAVSPAFAIRGDFEIPRLRQELRANAIELEGSLTCNMGAENNGQACALKFHSKSGQTYKLSNANEAMKLFSSGTKDVAIQGRLADAETIEVQKVSAR